MTLSSGGRERNSSSLDVRSTVGVGESLGAYLGLSSRVMTLDLVGERGFDGVLHDSRVVAREHELGVAREGGFVVEDSRLVVSGREPELEKGRRRVGHDVHVAHF